MSWEEIVAKARQIKETFDRSYKCLNIDRDTKEETVIRHLQTLIDSLENIRVLFVDNYSRLTTSHKTAADSFFQDVREKLITVASRKSVDIEIPESLHEKITLNLLKIEEIRDYSDNMAQTAIEFLGTASRILPDFDGRVDNLQSFLDALNLIDSIKGTHEAVAISLVKTKLKGAVRNLICTETTLQHVITKLKTSIKGETVDVVTAKLMNVRQQNKNTNNYATEVEDLAKRLETAYISDGIPTTLASTYATKTAVKAIAKNATNEKVKLIMEAGNFSNMNEVMAKFVNSCTETFGQPNSILHYRSKRRDNYRHRNTFNRNGNNQRHNVNSRNDTGNHRHYNNNYRGRGRNNYRNNNRNRNEGNQNIRLVSENNSENGQAPLNMQ